MIGRALDGLDPLGVGNREIRNSCREQCARGAGERGDLGDAGLVGQRRKPGELDSDALANQAEFAEVFRQHRDLVAIASVQRRQSGQRCKRGGVRHDVCKLDA